MKIERFPLIVGIVFLICTAFLISPVAAKPGDNPDPVCEICTKLNTIIADQASGTDDILAALDNLETAILDAINALQSDVDSIDDKIDTAQGDITTIKGDVSTIKTDVATIKTDVEAIDCGGSGSDYDYVMYTSPSLSDNIVFDVYAPGATDSYTVTVKDWHKSGTTGSFTYTNENTCGDVTLSQFNQDITCSFGGNELKIVQIIIPKAIRDKVTFTLINEGIRITQGDFKVDYI